MARPTPPVTVVHLARRANGLEPVRRFVASYLRHDAGIDHRLAVICKGFDGDGELRPELREVGAELETIVISDAGVDIQAYFAAAQRVQTELVCFLNSHSEILAAGWLARLVEAVRPKSVGVAGATGSFESAFLAMVQQTRREWRALVRAPSRLAPRANELIRCGATFPWYPNPHVRTNAFAIRTELFRKLSVRGADKQAALAFESGYAGLTRQVRRRGFEAVVVGADGRVFDSAAWPRSGTFRSGDQRNLLVHDNQTRRYQEASAEERRYLGRLAWGDRWATEL